MLEIIIISYTHITNCFTRHIYIQLTFQSAHIVCYSVLEAIGLLSVGSGLSGVACNRVVQFRGCRRGRVSRFSSHELQIVETMSSSIVISFALILSKTITDCYWPSWQLNQTLEISRLESFFNVDIGDLEFLFMSKFGEKTNIVKIGITESGVMQGQQFGLSRVLELFVKLLKYFAMFRSL